LADGRDDCFVHPSRLLGLPHYAGNKVHVNHQVIAFLLRLTKIKVFVPDEIDDDLPKNLLAPKTVTLEPMLYNISMIVFNTILNDSALCKGNDESSILAFATDIMSNIRKAAKENLLLYVKALFRHLLPARLCETTTNLYIKWELRMMAVRELLMEVEQK
jgi:hypothetical protein